MYHCVQTIDIVWSRPSAPRISISPMHPSACVGSNMWGRILSYGVSASGNYFAILSDINNFVYLDLWRVDIQDSGAWTSKKVGTGCLKEVDVNCSLEVSVSWDGSQIAVFRTSKVEPIQSSKEELIQTRCFWLFDSNISNTSTQSNDIQLLQDSTTEKNQRLMHTHGVNKFVGSRCMEKFIICDGVTGSIYSTNGVWDELYSIKVQYDMKSFDHSKILPSARFVVGSARDQWFLWRDMENVLIWHLETVSFVSVFQWASPIKSCEFLASDDKKIVLVIDGQLALFAAATGVVLKASTLPSQPASTPPSVPTRWIFPTSMEGLVRLFDIGHSSTLLSEAGCLVQAYKNRRGIDTNYRVHNPMLQGPTLITRHNGASLDILHLDDAAPQVDGSRLPERELSTTECHQPQSEHLQLSESFTITRGGLTLEIGKPRSTEQELVVFVVTPV